MRLWLSTLVVTVATWAMKASGPVALGDRPLSAKARAVVALMAPVLLSALIVVELGGESWDHVDAGQLAGVGVAGLARLCRVPMLLAVICGIAATALLRL